MDQAHHDSGICAAKAEGKLPACDSSSARDAGVRSVRCVSYQARAARRCQPLKGQGSPEVFPTRWGGGAVAVPAHTAAQSGVSQPRARRCACARTAAAVEGRAQRCAVKLDRGNGPLIQQLRADGFKRFTRVAGRVGKLVEGASGAAASACHACRAFDSSPRWATCRDGCSVHLLFPNNIEPCPSSMPVPRLRRTGCCVPSAATASLSCAGRTRNHC